MGWRLRGTAGDSTRNRSNMETVGDGVVHDGDVEHQVAVFGSVDVQDVLNDFVFFRLPLYKENDFKQKINQKKTEKNQKNRKKKFKFFLRI